MNKRALAGEVIESLRKGTPPERGVSLYSVGHEGLMDGIQKRQFRNPSNTGIIRFINGSYGSGKTHVFRILRELAYKNKRIVSTIEVRSDEAPFNKFEKVLHSVIRNISTPEQYATLADFDTLPPFGFTMKMALERLSGSNETGTRSEPTIDNFIKAREKLMSTSNIDIDFKKMVAHYWQTFMPESEDIVANEIRRGEIMQWFSGEGTVAQYRRKFEVNKMVSRDTSKTILESLVRFVQLAGYKGVVILFDEAEQSYSTMRRSQLREAQNNLLHFINTIGPIAGLYMVYATTPDFYMDPKHGIGTYPALASRIGLPSGKSPKALDVVWDLDYAVKIVM